MDSKEENVTFVDVLLGLMKRNNLDIYVTGINSKMLSSDVLTQFRDRGDRDTCKSSVICRSLRFV